MGKCTVLDHLGDGEYRIRLLRDTARAEDRVAQIGTDITTTEADLAVAVDAELAAVADVVTAQESINQLIRDADAANQTLLDALQTAIDELSDATDAVNGQLALLHQMGETRDEQLGIFDAQIDDLKAALAEAETDAEREAIQADIDALQLTRDAFEAAANSEITAATADLNDYRATQRTKQTAAGGAQDAWAARDQKIDEINQAIADAVPLQTTYAAARDKRAGLQLKLAAVQKEHAWITANIGTDPEVTAWCADLTEDLTGEVATIEIPGERRDVPVLIRPGYDSRADWQSDEQHAALVSAVTDALALVLNAESALDMARLNRAAQRQRVAAATDYLALVSARRPIVPELVTSAQAQLDAADLALTAADAAIPPAEDAVTNAQTTLDAARDALQAARDAAAEVGATPDPRMADGQLQPVVSSSPWATFWNQALLPAWQKWNPMYRLGEITAINADACDLVLDAATSSQQSIDINRETVLEAVPIIYMECNGDAFEVGDRVVVEFAYHDQTKPRVIGFESNPQGCGDHGIVGALAGDDAPLGYERTKYGSLYYADYNTVRYRDDAWSYTDPPRGSLPLTHVRGFGQFDWVYKRDGKFKGYLTWGTPASSSSGLFFTWYRQQCPNRFGDYSWANVLPITYDGRSPYNVSAVFLGGKLIYAATRLAHGSGVATIGAAIRHVTTGTPPAEKRYLIIVRDDSVFAIGDEYRYGPMMVFGVSVWAVDITDGPVVTADAWVEKVRQIHTIGQISLELPSIGNTAYGGVDRFTTFGSRGVRFRFNGSATRVSGVAHAQCQLGYDRNGDTQWHDWGETPLVIHIDIADDLTCTHTVEGPSVGSYSFSGSRSQGYVATGMQQIPPGTNLGEAHFTGSGTVPATTLMVDYVGDVEKRVTATDRCDYRCNQVFIAGEDIPFDIALDHAVSVSVGRHTIVEQRSDRRPLGEAGSTEYSGTRTERFQFLAVDPRYDFYAGLRMIYETTDDDPSSPDLPDGATVTFELEVNGVVVDQSTVPSVWFGSTTWAPKWDTGGMYNYINSTIAVDDAFNTMNGTTSRSGAYCLRPIRRATFRISQPFKWYLDAGSDPDWMIKTQSTPVIDFVPFALCLTDVASDEANPKTLFVTQCPTLSATTISGNKADGWGLLAQHQWVCMMVDANGNATAIDQVFGKAESLNPRFCGAGLV